MIKYTDQNRIKNQLFTTPFQQELNPANRWVQSSEIVPWDKLAQVFIKALSSEMGRGTIDLRTIMGAMIIQHSLNLTDRMTIDMISENVYMQYFVGLPTFQTAPIFDHSLLSIFRQRLGRSGGEALNDIVITHAYESEQIKHRKSRGPNKKDDGDESEQENTRVGASPKLKKGSREEIVENRGTVKIDATVVPQNITYPTDAKLLNHSREISETIIDELYNQLREEMSSKPRTYRREARARWLGFQKVESHEQKQYASN